MDYTYYLELLFKTVAIPLLGVLTTFIVAFIKSKIANINADTESVVIKKHIALIETIVVDAIIMTNQTYVNALKEAGKFTDPEVQKEAFKKTYNSVMALLTEKSKTFITEVFGDVETYITNLIESLIPDLKQPRVE